MNRKGLEEKKNDLIGQMKRMLNAAKTEKRDLSDEEKTKFVSLEKEIKGINKKIEREDKKNDMENNMENKESLREDSRKFVAYIRNVLANRADSNLDAGSNGAIIPTSIAKKIVMKAYDMCSILKDATKYNTKGNLVIPQYGDNDGTDITMAYAEEFVELESKVGKFTGVELGNYLAGALAVISKSLINNTDIDLEAKVIEIMALAVARFMERECLYGTDKKVEGLRGIKLKVTTASATAITVEDLIKLKNKIKKKFRKNAKWIMSNDTLTVLELLKDNQDRFVFREDLTGEFDGFLLGYPVEVSDNAEEIAAGKDVIFFGDYSGLALKQKDDAMELEVLREKFATQHGVGINAWVEFDAKVENTQKIGKMTMGA